MQTLLNRTRSTILILLACFLVSTSQPAFATGQDVRAMIEADFLNYQGSLEHAKDQFGVSENDSFAKARLGEEIPYYTVAKDSRTATDNGFALSGYLFPIELHGKQVGLVVAREANGKWSVLNISNEATLVQDIRNAKKLLPDPQDAKVVYDPSFTLYTLVSGKSIAPFQDQPDLKLKKNSVVPLAEFQANLESLKKAKLAAGKSQLVQLGGAGVQRLNRARERTKTTS